MIGPLCVQVALVAPAEAGLQRLRAKPRTLQRRTPALLTGLAAADPQGPQDCDGQTQRCSDCSTLLQCVRLGSVYRPLRTMACPAATPYCSAGMSTLSRAR